jgi:ApbE superfamily uncharacterized protein (UPF0280 family)
MLEILCWKFEDISTFQLQKSLGIHVNGVNVVTRNEIGMCGDVGQIVYIFI